MKYVIAGPVVAVLIYGLCRMYNIDNHIAITAAVVSICIIWWVSNAVPVPVTSLVPFALFPLTGVLNKEQIASAYGSSLILLLLGGFLLSKAMEYSGAHKKLAFLALSFFGYNNPVRLVFSLMFTVAALSMWISNMATVLMMLPIMWVILEKVNDKKLTSIMLLALAYSASIGGMGTPIGTPPNLIMMGVYEENNPGKSIDFLTWMRWSLPVVLGLLIIVGLWLTRSLSNHNDSLKHINIDEFSVPWNSASKRVVIIFLMTALSWVTRTSPFGGWGQWLPQATDASVAFLAVICLCTIRDAEKKPLLTWKFASTIPWGVLLLFAGGLALAKAFQVSGLSLLLANFLTDGFALPLFLMLLILSLGVSFLTETTSNTASTALLMPILAVAALANNLPLELIMLPATLSASCAFMLPVATAPNAIIFATDRIDIKTMAREGVVLNILGSLLISIWFYFLFS